MRVFSVLNSVSWFALTGSAGLIAASAAANDLEDCDDLPTNNPFLCATAVEFAAQATFIRNALISQVGSSGLRTRTSQKNADPKQVGAAGLTTRMSQQNVGREWFGLAVAGAQRTSGNFDGEAANLLLGVDTALSNTVSLGALVLVGNASTTPPNGVEIEREEALVGPYFTARLANGDGLTGYLLYGEPDYTISNVDSTGESLIGSLTWSRYIERPGADFAPFVSVSLKREEPNATDRVDATILTFGTSVDGEVVAIDNGFRQFFGQLELDVGEYDDTFGTTIDYTAPRIGGGVRFAFDSGSSLQLLANASAASDETTIVAAQVTYRFEF